MMTEAKLTFELAQSLVNAAIAEASDMGIAIAVSAVDSGGHLICFARMDGVSFMAVEVTRRKAMTSAAFKLPSQALNKIAESDPTVATDLAKNVDIV